MCNVVWVCVWWVQGIRVHKPEWHPRPIHDTYCHGSFSREQSSSPPLSDLIKYTLFSPITAWASLDPNENESGPIWVVKIRRRIEHFTCKRIYSHNWYGICTVCEQKWHVMDHNQYIPDLAYDSWQVLVTSAPIWRARSFSSLSVMCSDARANIPPGKQACEHRKVCRCTSYSHMLRQMNALTNGHFNYPMQDSLNACTPIDSV